jgi:glycosyltransferase involved in cell wall biosynthesis
VTGASALRILIITGIFPPDIGGPATYVPQIATGLANLGHQVSVLTLSDQLDHDDRAYAFAVKRLPRKCFRLWRWFRTMAQIMHLGRQADVLFVNGLALESVLANVWLRKPLVQKVVGDLAWEQATNRGWVADDFEVFQQRRYGVKVEALKSMRAWWTRKADQVIVPSRYLARWVTRLGISAGRISVIYNALDPMDAVQRAQVPLPTPVNVATICRLIPLKRVDHVIGAIAQCEGVGLVIVGDGPERAALERVACAAGLTERVHFAGQRPRGEALSLLAACDLLVLNSTHEAYPHVVLEAMSLGLPVIATAVGGTPEIVRDGENGRLIAPDASGALVEALLKLVSSNAERQRLVYGAERTVERFSLDRMVLETEAVLWKTASARMASQAQA